MLQQGQIHVVCCMHVKIRVAYTAHVAGATGKFNNRQVTCMLHVSNMTCLMHVKKVYVLYRIAGNVGGN